MIIVDPRAELYAVTSPLKLIDTLQFEDDHVPPEVELDKVVVEPAQIDVAPEICESIVG